MKELLIQVGKLGEVKEFGDAKYERAGSPFTFEDLKKSLTGNPQGYRQSVKADTSFSGSVLYNIPYGVACCGLHLNSSLYKDRTLCPNCQDILPHYDLYKDEIGKVYQIRPKRKSMIHERLRTIRRSLGMSQQDFANRLGKTLKTIQRWESGQYNIPESALRLISHTFGVSYEWLKEGKGEMWERVPAEVQISIIKDIVRELKRIEEEYDIDIPPDLFAEAVESIYEEVTREFTREEDRKKLIKRGVGKIIKLTGS